MISNLLDDGIIKVTRVAQEVRANLVGMFKTLEDTRCNRELRPLSQLGPLGLTFDVDILHPAVVDGCGLLGYMLLENNDVRVGDFDSIGSREYGSRFTVDCFGVEGWC